MSAWVAYNENPTIVCASGKTEAAAFKKMSKKLEKIMAENEYVVGLNFYYDDSDECIVNVVISNVKFDGNV